MFLFGKDSWGEVRNKAEEWRKKRRVEKVKKERERRKRYSICLFFLSSIHIFSPSQLSTLFSLPPYLLDFITTLNEIRTLRKKGSALQPPHPLHPIPISYTVFHHLHLIFPIFLSPNGDPNPYSKCLPSVLILSSAYKGPEFVQTSGLAFTKLSLKKWRFGSLFYKASTLH